MIPTSVPGTDTYRLKDFLDEQVEHYNQTSFIEDDPIQIPHQFNQLQDIEISGFWTAILSWGQRKTILAKARELFEMMDGAPYEFILHHREADRKPFLSFRHRTFQPADTLYFLEFLQSYYQHHHSLEEAFFGGEVKDVYSALCRFHHIFFQSENFLPRTRKHVATPARHSSCKRLNMFLRWMVRKDDHGVDFGLWSRCQPRELMIPLDIHVLNVSMRLGLLKRNKADWKSVVELTAQLRLLDADDPVKYDYALFSLGVQNKWPDFSV